MYKHAANGAIIARAAQPLTGLASRSCKEDIELLNIIRTQGQPPESEFGRCVTMMMLIVIIIMFISLWM